MSLRTVQGSGQESSHKKIWLFRRHIFLLVLSAPEIHLF